MADVCENTEFAEVQLFFQIFFPHPSFFLIGVKQHRKAKFALEIGFI